MLKKYVKIILLLLIPLLLWPIACSKEDKFVGAYISIPGSPAGSGYPQVYLELNKGGKGMRRVGEQTVSFRWKVKGDEIRIVTRSGGIITGKLLEKDILVVRLPGPKLAYLKKIR